MTVANDKDKSNYKIKNHKVSKNKSHNPPLPMTCFREWFGLYLAMAQQTWSIKLHTKTIELKIL